MSNKNKFVLEYILYILLVLICCWFSSVLIEKKSEKLLKQSIYNSLFQISQDWPQVKIRGLSATIEGNAPTKYDSLKIIRHLQNKYPFLKLENKTTHRKEVSFFDKISFIRLFKENKNIFLIGYFPEEGIKAINKFLNNKDLTIKNLILENEEAFDQPLENAIEMLQKIMFMNGIVTAEVTRKSLLIKMSRQEKQNEKRLNSKIEEYEKKRVYPKIEIEYLNKVLVSSKKKQTTVKTKNNNPTEKLSQKEKVPLVLEKKNGALELKGELPEIIKSNLISFFVKKHPSLKILDNLKASKTHDVLITNAFIKSTNLVNIMEQFKLSLSTNGLEILGTTDNEVKAKKIIDTLITESKLKNKNNLIKIEKLIDTNNHSANKKTECQKTMHEINASDSISFREGSFKLTGNQIGYTESLLIKLKKCLIFGPSIIGYGDKYLSSKHSRELGLARASSIYLKMLETYPYTGEVNILGETAKNIFKMEHNQQMNKKIPNIEIRFSK
ncbi:hypothetical protein CBE37_00595 [bacterium TMED277]|nr:MAG: hypothetical protein CBE37_00595 [bacterium TMED277]